MGRVRVSRPITCSSKRVVTNHLRSVCIINEGLFLEAWDSGILIDPRIVNEAVSKPLLCVKIFKMLQRRVEWKKKHTIFFIDKLQNHIKNKKYSIWEEGDINAGVLNFFQAVAPKIIICAG